MPVYAGGNSSNITILLIFTPADIVHIRTDSTAEDRLTFRVTSFHFPTASGLEKNTKERWAVDTCKVKYLQNVAKPFR